MRSCRHICEAVLYAFIVSVHVLFDWLISCLLLEYCCMSKPVTTRHQTVVPSVADSYYYLLANYLSTYIYMYLYVHSLQVDMRHKQTEAW